MTMPAPTVRDLSTGWSVLEVRGRHVPGYDPEEVGAGLSPALYRAEVEGDWTATGGKLVFPEWDPERFVAERPLPFSPGIPLVCGWDLPAGTGGRLAMVPMQLQPGGCLYVYPGLLERDEQVVGVWEFGRLVMEHLTRMFALPAGIPIDKLSVTHVGDPAGKQKPPRTAGQVTAGMEARSAKEILYGGQRLELGLDERGRSVYEHQPGFGIVMLDGIVSRTKREDLLRARMSYTLGGGAPALLVDPEARDLIEALGGGYHYPERADGLYDYQPAKNRSSHVVDACCYAHGSLAAARVMDDEDRQQRPPKRRPIGGRAGWE